MFDLTTIQLRNVEARMNGQLQKMGVEKLSPGAMVKAVTASAAIARVSPVEALDACSKEKFIFN